MIAMIKIIDSMYYFAIFVKEYLETEELWRLSFAGLKVVQLVQVAITLECGDYLPTLNEWLGAILGWVGVVDPLPAPEECTGEECPAAEEGAAEEGAEGAEEVPEEEVAEEETTRRRVRSSRPSLFPLVQNEEEGLPAAGETIENPASLATDPFGNIFETSSTEVSTAAFEWIYQVFKGGQSVVSLAELGVDIE